MQHFEKDISVTPVCIKKVSTTNYISTLSLQALNNIISFVLIRHICINTQYTIDLVNNPVINDLILIRAQKENNFSIICYFAVNISLVVTEGNYRHHILCMFRCNNYKNTAYSQQMYVTLEKWLQRKLMLKEGKERKSVDRVWLKMEEKIPQTSTDGWEQQQEKWMNEEEKMMKAWSWSRNLDQTEFILGKAGSRTDKS